MKILLFLLAMTASAQTFRWNPFLNNFDFIGSSGGGAVYSLTGLVDTVRTSATVLTVASSCAAAPATCQVRFGNTVFQIAASGTCTISAGTGTMFEYIATDGKVKCGSNGLTLVCSLGCDVTTSITAFPATSIPLYSWTATSGTWDVSGSSDWRAVLSTKNVTGGPGINCVDSGGTTTCSFSGAGGYAVQADAATVTWDTSSAAFANAVLTFTVHSGNRTLNLSNLVAGGNYQLKLIQDSTGGEGLILGTGCTWKVAGGGSGAVTLSTGASAIDLLSFTYDGTNCLAAILKNFN